LRTKQLLRKIQNIRTIAKISQEGYFYQTFETSILNPHKMTVNGAFVPSFGFSFSQSVLHFAWAASLYYGAFLLKLELYDSNQILRAMFSIIFAAMAAGQVTNFAPDAAKARLAAAQVFKLLGRTSKIDVNSGLGEQRPTSVGTVELSAVEFAYPSRTDAQILKGLDILAQLGKTFALVGKSGCGKSTVMGLLLRWYDSNAGHVKYDDLDVESWNLTSLRSFMAIVGQEPGLFSTSIRDNIAYGATKYYS
jgi:ATP-binding cassette subfamily B (MDR/TAP) protein 1